MDIEKRAEELAKWTADNWVKPQRVKEAILALIREAVAEATQRAERAEAAMHKLLSVVDYPDNGVHYCRWCRGGTSNNWQHDPGCHYVEQIKRIDEARAAGRAALSPATPDAGGAA